MYSGSELEVGEQSSNSRRIFLKIYIFSDAEIALQRYEFITSHPDKCYAVELASVEIFVIPKNLLMKYSLAKNLFLQFKMWFSSLSNPQNVDKL